MTPSDDLEPKELSYRIRTLLCRRTNQFIEPKEHLSCPYCFGREADVQRGVHERFCDYQPGRDPVHFGFPVEGERDIEG